MPWEYKGLATSWPPPEAYLAVVRWVNGDEAEVYFPDFPEVATTTCPIQTGMEIMVDMLISAIRKREIAGQTLPFPSGLNTITPEVNQALVWVPVERTAALVQAEVDDE